MKNYIKKLNAAHDTLDSIISMTVRELASKIEFDDYSIFYQPSDGFVLEYEANNAPLTLCIDIIKEKGQLSLEDYMDIRI